jgi:hypothetical protein
VHPTLIPAPWNQGFRSENLSCHYEKERAISPEEKVLVAAQTVCSPFSERLK